MVEKAQSSRNITNESHDLLGAIREKLGLSVVDDPVKAREVLDLLSSVEERFLSQDWRGGANDQFSFGDVRSLLRGAEEGKLPTSRWSANSTLAFLEALQVVGANPPLSDAEYDGLVERAGNEQALKTLVPAAQALAREAQADPGKDRKSKKRALRAAVVLPLVFAAIAGTWKLWDSDAIRLGQSEATGPRSQEISEGIFSAGEEAARQESTQSESASLLSQLREAVVSEPLPERVPQVEEVSSNREGPYDLWGIDFSDSEQGIAVIWDAPEIVERNGGEPLRIVMFPVPYVEGTRFGRECSASSGYDCSKAHNGMVLVGGHTSHDFSMEDFRFFLEGYSSENGWQYWSVEEREVRRQLLEQFRPTVSYGDVAVRPQAGILRIPPRETDRVYEAWFRGGEETMDIALDVDPSLGARVDLSRPFAALAGCGRRLSGDLPAPSRQPDYQSTVYVLTLGEAGSLSQASDS